VRSASRHHYDQSLHHHLARGGDIQSHTVRILALQDEDSLDESEVAAFTSKDGPVDFD